MTRKQQQILEAAIQLFSEEGFNATSTSNIAKNAQVSEGLIFRHFKNKAGLLKEVLNRMQVHLNQLFSDVLNENEPKEIIRKTLKIPFNIKEHEIDFWRFQFKLVYELDKKKSFTFYPLNENLELAFEKLRYKNPKLETEFFIYHLDGLTNSIINNEMLDKDVVKEFMLKKYYL